MNAERRKIITVHYPASVDEAGRVAILDWLGGCGEKPDFLQFVCMKVYPEKGYEVSEYKML